MKYTKFKWNRGPSFIFNEGFLDFPWLPLCIAWNWSGLKYYYSVRINGTIYMRALTHKFGMKKTSIKV